MLQTAQRVGSAVGVALVLAQFFAQLTMTRDVGAAFTSSLRITLAFVVAALLAGIADLVISRRRIPRADPNGVPEDDPT